MITPDLGGSARRIAAAALVLISIARSVAPAAAAEASRSVAPATSRSHPAPATAPAPRIDADELKRLGEKGSPVIGGVVSATDIWRLAIIKGIQWEYFERCIIVDYFSF